MTNESPFTSDAVPTQAVPPECRGLGPILPSEAVMAFAAWLTMGPPLKVGVKHEASPMVKAAMKFCAGLGWEDIRDGYMERVGPLPGHDDAPPAHRGTRDIKKGDSVYYHHGSSLVCTAKVIVVHAGIMATDTRRLTMMVQHPDGYEYLVAASAEGVRPGEWSEDE